MPQYADPDFEPGEDEGQDAFRQQIEQIVARRNLMKARGEPSAAVSAPKPASLRKPAPEDFPPDAAAFDDEAPVFAEEADFDAEFVAFAADPDTTPPRAPSAAGTKDMPPEPGERPQRPTDRRQGERRQGERRNMEFLRTEIQWSANPEPAENQRALSRGGNRFKPSRLVLLAVALLCAGIAGWLALSGSPAPTPQPAPAAATVAVEEPTTEVLVATAEIGAGQHLSETSIGWHKLPVSAVLPGYITVADRPSAVTDLNASVARYPFLPGDPIRDDKLVVDAPRTLAAALRPGMRGVSVAVTPDTAAGGFVKPDDRVDVVLVTGPEDKRVIRTVLENVRVLALNARLGPETTGEVVDAGDTLAEVFSGAALATIELDPEAAEVLVRAAASGTLILSLRPENPGTDASAPPRSGADQTIRLTSRFWMDAYSPAAN